MAFFCYKWGKCSVPWNTANWTWRECRLIADLLADIRPGVPGELAIPTWLREETPHNPYSKDKREQFIRLLCKVRGYSEYDDKKKERNDIEVGVEDVVLVVKTVSGIDITANTKRE